MKGTFNTTIVLAISLATVSGLFGLTASGVIGTADNSSGVTEGAFMLGHVKTIVTDSEGNIKHYKQSDNLIVQGGEDCAAKALFDYGGPASTSTDRCTGGLTDGFHYIALGNSSTAVAAAQSSLSGEHDGGLGLERAAGSVVMTNSSGTSAGNTVVISHTFTNTGDHTQTVEESGLFNATAGGTSPASTPNADGMFARQTTGTVTVGAGDDLTVEWTINIGGATTLDAS